MVIMKMSTI